MRGRAIARPSCVYTVDHDDIVDIIDNSGEFVNFTSFLEFSLEKKSISMSISTR